jgi:hypothetical protein
MGAARDDIMLAAEMLAAHDKMIDVVQVAVVLRRLGLSADDEVIRAVLNDFAAEQPPRLRRITRVVGAGPGELIFYFVLPTAPHDVRP